MKDQMNYAAFFKYDSQATDEVNEQLTKGVIGITTGESKYLRFVGEKGIGYNYQYQFRLCTPIKTSHSLIKTIWWTNTCLKPITKKGEYITDMFGCKNVVELNQDELLNIDSLIRQELAKRKLLKAIS